MGTMRKTKGRKGIEKLIEVVRREKKKGGRLPFFIVEFPTGYGKTKSVPEIFNELSDEGWAENVIHVLPLRVLVRNLLEDLYEMRLYNKNGPINLAYQMGDYIQSLDYKKEDQGKENNEQYKPKKRPLFDADYVLTTMDSFVHNFFKAPITELFKFNKHYFLPLGKIFTSLTVYDEAHIYFKNDENEIPTLFYAALEAHWYMRNPVLILSATLPDVFFNTEVLSQDKYIRLRLGEKDEDKRNEIIIHDEEFEKEMLSVVWKTQTIKKEDIVNKIKELVYEGKRVLVIIDSLKKVMKIYKEVCKDLSQGNECVLIHGRLIRKDRDEAASKLRTAKVVLGTSAIEAGIDVSFDALITTATNPNSVVQRVGRVFRYGNKEGKCDNKNNEAEIYIVEENNNKIIEFIKEHKMKINWRLPYKKDGYEVSYLDLIRATSDYYYRIDYKFMYNLKSILAPLYTPNEVINRFLRKNNFSLTRSLIEVYVRGIEDFKKIISQKPDENSNKKTSEREEFNKITMEIMSNSLVLGINEINGRIFKYVEGIGYLTPEGYKVIEKSPKCDFERLYKELMGKKKIQRSREVEKLYGKFIEEYKSTPILILRKDRYKEHVGLRVNK
ncbi:CRISPR-associated helicase Cas3' [Sulfolobus sp. E5-1-F]|uniref:CRISPR-associated helicase Cas3' n=1 Tax=Saccharolobus sp. E5-1-F TaxID=2663019 RepID=UPI0012972141|nr:CRISPR-associated helicase Cas3' [Sulfolobus sp. E5-1-F]QGA53929.1 CRISPR-associated helicase Cas3' [Sulfolobus sp. E5-1-F]